MILSAGLTPAWQQVMVFDSLRLGEVNRAKEVRWLAQGKVLNAGIAAHHLGGPSLTLAPLGGPALELIDHEFEQLGVPRRWIKTRSATRSCTTIIDRSSGKMTELVENGRPLEASELAEYLEAYSEEAARATVAIITGSLPEGTPCTYYRDMLLRTPCPVVLDFRGEGLWNVLELKPLVVKPNREELSKTVGWPINDNEELLDAMRTLNLRGAQWVVVTSGPGPVWLTSQTKKYRFESLRVSPVRNPIGSGDCMAAAIAWAIRDGRNMVDAVKLGIAAAAENVLQYEVGRLEKSAVLEKANQVVVEDLS